MDDLAKQDIGSGAYGKVWLLEEFNPPIVMKEIEIISGLLDKQQEELTALKELSHPNIVKFRPKPTELTLLQISNKLLIFMEFCEEGSLRSLITNLHRKYSAATIVQWAQELFTALAFLKTKRIVHFDIKPENVLLTRTFVLKVADFGIMQKFDEETTTAIPPQGTFPYMPPEARSSNRMNIEGIHKCDLFAAGLIIWELLERRNLPKDWATISFLHNLTAESKKLGDLILGCSSPSTRIEERFSVEEALERVESLKKVFQDLRHQHPGKFLVEPQICNQKKLLELPEGVFEPETVKTNFTFSILSFGGVAGGTGNYAVTENAPEIIVKLDPLMQTFLHEWTPKIERKSNFVKLSIPESEEKLNCIDSFKFLVNSNSVNEMRNRIGAEISMKINAFEEKAILAKEMQGLIEFIFEKHSAHDEAKQLIRNKITIYLLDKKFQSEELKSILEALSELLILDLNIQEILYRFSIYALWNCELMNLSWVELSELLQLAITNLEEAEMNFTRRKRFRTFNIGDSRAEWCTSFGISFRKDLTEIREDLLKNILTPRERHLDVIAIDLETFRRALYEKLDDVKRYSVNEVKNDPESVQTLEQFLKSSNQTGEFSGNRSKNKNNYTINFLPTSEEELFEKTTDKTLFPRYLYFWNYIPKSKLELTCACAQQCPVGEFPEKTPLKELKLKFSTCPSSNQKDFLAVHSLFDRAFRLMHLWKEIDVYKYTMEYLLENLLAEIELKKDPRIGFYFVYLKEKQIYTQYCHDGGEENEEREGLLIGLNVKSLNSFWHHDFRFESISHFCFTEFFRSVYIGLYELKPILDLMLQELRNMKTVTHRKPEDVMESSYHKSMKEEINKFWKARQIFVLPKSAEIDANSAYKWQKSPSTRPDHKRRSF